MNSAIVITGGGGVLGTEFARAMAGTGAPVALIDLGRGMAKETASEICADGGRAKAYVANVLDRESLEKVHEQIVSDFGKCRVLINGAGGNSPRCTTDKEAYCPGDIEDKSVRSFFNLDEEGFRFVFDLNLMGTLLPTQIFASDMLGEENCCIINISSMNSYRPLTKIPAYSAAKAAVSNFTQWMAVHFADADIRVNAIAPGFFVTGQNRALLFDSEGKMTPRSEKIIAATPMKRFGEPKELTGTLLWLADNKASGFVTGITVPVDGGFSAYSGV